MRYLRKIRGVFSLAILLALVLSCAKDRYFETDHQASGGSSYVPQTKGRVTPVVDRNVMIMISGGRNSLAGYLSDDLAEIEESDIPSGRFATKHVLVVFSRIGSNKNQETPCVLYRLYRDQNGNAVRDTLRTWGGFEQMFGGNTMKEALRTVVDEFPGSHYGIVLSSHATGYLPDGYYKDPSAYEQAHGGGSSSSTLSLRGRGVLSPEEFEPIPEYPAVKSVGQDDDVSGSVEMEIRAFRDALPCHMDYILFDACLMACIEVAYELRDMATIIGFSPTEILADGFDYKLLASRLVTDSPDPVQVCRDYFEQYRILPEGSDTRCATISAVDTRYLEDFAAVCRTLFEKYRTAMGCVNADSVQRYFRAGRHFFYDIRDILSKSGASEEDLREFDSALGKVVIYKDHTPSFLGIQIKDDSYSGLSMYLPRMGSRVLDDFYRENISWNAATQLVK